MAMIARLTSRIGKDLISSYASVTPVVEHIKRIGTIVVGSGRRIVARDSRIGCKHILVCRNDLDIGGCRPVHDHMGCTCDGTISELVIEKHRPIRDFTAPILASRYLG